MAKCEPDSKKGAPEERVLYREKAHLLPNIYKMDHSDRGYAVIINNKKFIDAPERTGTDKDRDDMKDLLVCLGFQKNHIIVENNCTTMKMEDTMKTVADKYDVGEYDCFVAVILSHGDSDGNIMGEGHEDVITADHLTEHVRGSNCKGLIGKPKIFIMQICRGEVTDKGESKVGADADEDESLIVQVPSEADFLLAFSVVPGYKSWRNSLNGSWFIQSVVKIFKKDEQWKREDIVTMLTEVNKTVAIDYGDRYLKQMPCISSMLLAKVIFSEKHVAPGKKPLK